MPNCASNSVCSSRRSSRGSTSYIMMNVGGGGSGTTSRRSSGGGSRRGSLLAMSEHPSLGGSGHWPDPAAVAAMSSSQVPSGGNLSGPTSAGAAVSGATSGATNTANNLLQTIGSGVVGAASSLYQNSVTPSRYKKAFSVHRPSFK